MVKWREFLPRWPSCFCKAIKANDWFGMGIEFLYFRMDGISMKEIITIDSLSLVVMILFMMATHI